jgi:hypothetical protein
MVYINPYDQLRLQRGVEHLHKLGPRPTAELLADVAAKIGGLPCILSTLEEYKRLSPRQLRLAGGDRFPPRPLRAVPRS